MANHFLIKTQISLDNCLRLDDTLMLEKHEELRTILRDRLGGPAAGLFAEPLLSRGNDSAPASVSWYGEHEGNPRPLSALPMAARGAVETYLSDTLGPMRALLDDLEVGPLLGAALWQMESSDVMVVGGRPVLINWGMRPARLGSDTFALSAHYGATLGRYLPLATPPGLKTAEGVSSGTAPPGAVPSGAAIAGAAVASGAAGTTDVGQSVETVGGTETQPVIATAAPNAVAEGAGVAGAATPSPGYQGPLPKVAWVPLVVLLALALSVLVWLLVPGTRLFPNAGPAPVVRDAAALALAEQVNRDLAVRRDLLETALSGSVCLADGTLVTPEGRTPQGLLPPARHAPGIDLVPGDAPGDQTQAAPDSILPTNPDRVVIPDPTVAADPGAGTSELSTVILRNAIERRTVLVLAINGSLVGHGTGFVVGPGLIITNYHVISDVARGATIFVAHKSLAEPAPAQVLKTLGPLDMSGGDFALLQIADTSLPAYPIHMASETLKLTNVIAAGFPGDVLETDSAFAALQRGDPSAMPGLTLNDGTISTEQALSPSTNVLVHSAPISYGNSGGPLVDFCGRVIGVNTFVKAGDLRTLNFALSSADIKAFLSGTPASPNVVSDRCVPQVTRPAPPPAALPSEEGAPAPVSPSNDGNGGTE